MPGLITITVEVVARITISDDVPLRLLYADKNMAIPLRVSPLSPTIRGYPIDSHVLTIQHRITEGDFFLHPEPYPRRFP